MSSPASTITMSKNSISSCPGTGRQPQPNSPQAANVPLQSILRRCSRGTHRQVTILNTGAQWHMLPQSYPNYKTVHRRFQTWCRDEVLRRVLTDVANELRDRGVLNEEECFI